jgi:hypothetical protein
MTDAVVDLAEEDIGAVLLVVDVMGLEVEVGVLVKKNR